MRAELKYLAAILLSLALTACSEPADPAPPVEADVSVDLSAGIETRRVTFESGAHSLSGLLDTPSQGEARGLVIFVHGYGPTDVVAQNWYYDLRSRFAEAGVSSLVWDKPGQGDSDGTFDPDRPVADSAQDVLSAARWLREQEVPGSHRIGLWGISRAGWIAPIALSQDPDLAFWISVSGVDAKESFGHLLESNWRLKGYTEGMIAALLDEWRTGTKLFATGASYADYLAATQGLRADPFVQTLTGGEEFISESAYKTARETSIETPPIFDEQTGLQIYVPAFEDRLAELDVPVLALFGERDTSVDWRATLALYKRTLGENPNASLRVVTFPTGNHNLHISKTGGFEEMIAQLGTHEMVPDYYKTILTWLDGVLETG